MMWVLDGGYNSFRISCLKLVLVPDSLFAWSGKERRGKLAGSRAIADKEKGEV